MIKIVFCDNLDDLRNHELVNAFKAIYKDADDKLFYLTANHVVYKLNNDTWELEADANELSIDVLEESYILLDTKWDESTNVKNEIINWCEQNNDSFKKVLVYSTYGRDEAEILNKYLKTKNISVFPDSYFMISDCSFEQFAHFKKILNEIKKDYERNFNIINHE